VAPTGLYALQPSIASTLQPRKGAWPPRGLTPFNDLTLQRSTAPPSFRDPVSEFRNRKITWKLRFHSPAATALPDSPARSPSRAEAGNNSDKRSRAQPARRGGRKHSAFGAPNVPLANARAREPFSEFNVRGGNFETVRNRGSCLDHFPFR